jgi:hypothetical protein
MKLLKKQSLKLKERENPKFKELGNDPNGRRRRRKICRVGKKTNAETHTHNIEKKETEEKNRGF